MSTSQLDINTQVDGTTAILRLSGRLTVATSSDLESVVVGLPASVSDLTIDLSNLEYISSAGLRVLVSAEKMVVARGGHMRLGNPNESITEVFELTGLAEVFDIVSA